MKKDLDLGVNADPTVEDAEGNAVNDGNNASTSEGLSRNSSTLADGFVDCPKTYKLADIGTSYFEVEKFLPDLPQGDTASVHSEVNGGTCRALSVTDGNEQLTHFCKVNDVNVSGFMAGITGAGPKTTTTTLGIKLTGYEDKKLQGSIFGAENATVDGSVFLDVATSGATPGNISGTQRADVTGDVEVILEDSQATYVAPVVAGDCAPNSDSTIHEGTKLQIEGGTFARPVIAGGLGGKIKGGSLLCINDGRFDSKVMAGGFYGVTIHGIPKVKPAVSMLVNKGVFNGEVSAAGWDNIIAGDVQVFVEAGEFNRQISAAKTNDLVLGNVLMVIGGGTFHGDVVAGATSVHQSSVHHSHHLNHKRLPHHA